jgi:hypothetical protein
MSVLFEMLSGGKPEPVLHTLPTKLIVRDSAAPPPKRGK